MDRQRELQWKMRSILIDWLIEVHNKFKLLPETLFLAVNILDRFLTLRNVSLSKLQLVGVTCLFIASKYEEVYAPSITQFVYIADGGFSTDEIVRAERYLLSTLEYDLSFPNPLNFLRRCSKADEYDIQSRTVAKYFMEVMEGNEKYLHLGPSIKASIGLYLARVMLCRGPWVNELSFI